MRDCRFALRGENCNRVNCHFNHNLTFRFNQADRHDNRAEGRGWGHQSQRGRFRWNGDGGQGPPDYDARQWNDSWSDSGGPNRDFQER